MAHPKFWKYFEPFDLFEVMTRSFATASYSPIIVGGMTKAGPCEDGGQFFYNFKF